MLPQELHASVFPPPLFSFLFRSGPFNQLADCLPENALSFHWSSWFGQPNHLHWVAMHTFQRYGWCGHKNCYLSGVEYGISGVGIFCWGQKPFGINEMMLIWAKERSNELRHYTRHIYLFRFEIYAIPTKKLHVLRHRIYIWTKVMLCWSWILARNMYPILKPCTQLIYTRILGALEHNNSQRFTGPGRSLKRYTLILFRSQYCTYRKMHWRKTYMQIPLNYGKNSYGIW